MLKRHDSSSGRDILPSELPPSRPQGLNTLCVQSVQSRTRSSEIAFLRTVLVWLITCIPYQLNNFQTTQKRNPEIALFVRIV